MFSCAVHMQWTLAILSQSKGESFLHTHARRVPSVARELTDLNVGPGGSRTTGQRACVCVSILPPTVHIDECYSHMMMYILGRRKKKREREIDGGGYEREADRMIGLISKTTPSHNRKRFYFYFRLPIISPPFFGCLSDV